MEKIEERKPAIEHTVRRHLDDFERRLTGELIEKLAERMCSYFWCRYMLIHKIFAGEKIYSAERDGYLQEIDALRTTVARIEQLEAENGNLKAELQAARQRQQECSKGDGCSGTIATKTSIAASKADARTEVLTVDIDVYNHVKEDLDQLQRDYGKLVWARDHLETKVREQKGTLRQWKEYRKIWILKHPTKRLGHLQPSSARASPLTAEDNGRSSSAPAPPALPKGFTPSPSGFSRSSSPSRTISTKLEPTKSLDEQAVERSGNHCELQPQKASISQAGQNAAYLSGSDDVTDATPESEGQAKPIKPEPAPGGSSPIIILERSLKQRHYPGVSVQNVHVHEDNQRRSGASPGTLPPKEEQISSPIAAQPLTHLNGPYDSLDLDDVGGHLDTPRKRQRMAQERIRSSMILPLTAVQGEMTADASIQYSDEKSREVESERDKEEFTPDEHEKPPRKLAEEEKKARRDQRMTRQHAHNDRVHQRLEAADKTDPVFDSPRSSSPTTDESAQQPHTPDDPRAILRQRKPHLNKPVILQPRDINASVLPRTSDPFSNRKRPCPPSRRDRGAAHVPVVAEDGEGLSPDGDALKPGKKSRDDRSNSHGPPDKEPKAPSIHHRLEALLTRPSPEKSLLIPEEPVVAVFPDQAWSKTPIPRSVYHSRSKGLATPRSVPAKKSGIKHSPGRKPGLTDIESIDGAPDGSSKSAHAVTKRTKDVPNSHKPSPLDYPETRPEHEPLRARPIQRLGLQDFKLNPTYSDYAYHETVRKHDEKKALSGCTDRHCPRCKGLRKHVIDSGYKTAQKPGESEDNADWRLMRDYLGDNHRQLKSMSTKEKSDLLIEAKVKEFANRYGCHRQAFPRAREAPGLWAVDFPSTQEEAENRAQADVMEREMVEERYWEATRRGGKWIFADE